MGVNEWFLEVWRVRVRVRVREGKGWIGLMRDGTEMEVRLCLVAVNLLARD